MPEAVLNDLISYDNMREQIYKELSPFSGAKRGNEIIELPDISFEKGVTCVRFRIPSLSEKLIINVMSKIKSYLENLVIHTFEPSFYSFYAFNKNILSGNIFDGLRVTLSGISSFGAELTKKGNLSQEEVNLVVQLYRVLVSSDESDPFTELQKLGASVFNESSEFGWDYIAGYEEVKRKIRESIILPLQNPDIYDSIAKLTRRKFESNRPRAILFEGSPGVGKTTAARIIASDVKIPLIYLPIESIMSKWYGQSSKNLSSIFDFCEEIGSSILFLDEIDALATARDQNMYEATRRILSVLLRRLDGIESVSNTITIGATNRKNDLDPALISRFDQSIYFPLPNLKERAAIFSNYASHLNEEELSALAGMTENVSGRNIKDLCEYTERRWARKIIVQKLEVSPPSVEYYKYTISLWMDDSTSKKQ